MAAEAIDYGYRYRAPSQVETKGAGSRIRLVTMERAERTLFFSGALTSPRKTADLMLALTRVVHSRFYTPPAMLEKILTLADPVITCGSGRLRLEGFSACCGAYARVDLLPEAFEAERVETGTTNVDFNPPMRAALAGVRDGDPAHLRVGPGEAELETAGGSVIERRVKLPMRWLKGFGEAQAHQARMERRFTLSGPAAMRFLREIPRQASRGPVFVSPLGAAVWMSKSASGGAVRVGGIERLKLLEGVVRQARSLTAYESGDGATGWALDSGFARFFLALSPETWRGFSGEGQGLMKLALAERRRVTGGVRAALRWQSVIDAASLSASLNADRESVEGALAELAVSGLVGYDLAEAAYFHRELPFDVGFTEKLEPRLKAARELVATGAVRIEGGEGWVRSGEMEYRVRKTVDGWKCTCPWVGKHGTGRGPCKHVLAFEIVSGGEDVAG